MTRMSMDLVFRALADPSRRQLLDRLHAENGQTLGQLCEGLAMTRQAVTKHLAILEAANLVVARRQGTGEAALHQPGADQRDR
jgi:DNA-binding transcriptional ArsR family regulator